MVGISPPLKYFFKVGIQFVHKTVLCGAESKQFQKWIDVEFK